MENNKPKWRGNSFQSLSDWAKTQKQINPEPEISKPGSEPKGIKTDPRKRANRNTQQT